MKINKYLKLSLLAGSVISPVAIVVACGKTEGLSIEYIKSAEYHFLDAIFSNEALNNSVGDKEISTINANDFHRYVENHRIFKLLPATAQKNITNGIADVVVNDGVIDFEYDDFTFKYIFSNRFENDGLYTVDEVNKNIDIDASSFSSYGDIIDTLIDVWKLDTWKSLSLPQSINSIYKQSIGTEYDPSKAFDSYYAYEWEKIISRNFSYSLNFINGEENYIFNARSLMSFSGKDYDPFDTGDEYNVDDTDIFYWFRVDTGQSTLAHHPNGSLDYIRDAEEFDAMWSYLSQSPSENYSELIGDERANGISWDYGYTKPSYSSQARSTEFFSTEAGTILKWWRSFVKSDFAANIITEKESDAFDWNYHSYYDDSVKLNRKEVEIMGDSGTDYDDESHPIYNPANIDADGFDLISGSLSNTDMILVHKLSNILTLDDEVTLVDPRQYLDVVEMELVREFDSSGNSYATIEVESKIIDDKFIINGGYFSIPAREDYASSNIIIVSVKLEALPSYYFDKGRLDEYNWSNSANIEVLFDLDKREIIGSTEQVLEVEHNNFYVTQSPRLAINVEENPDVFDRGVDEFNFKFVFEHYKLLPEYINILQTEYEWNGEAYDVENSDSYYKSVMGRDVSAKITFDISNANSMFYRPTEHNPSSKIAISFDFTFHLRVPDFDPTYSPSFSELGEIHATDIEWL